MIVMFFSDLVYCNFFVEALILKFCLNLLLYLLLKLYTEVFFINDSNHFLVRVKLLASIHMNVFLSRAVVLLQRSAWSTCDQKVEGSNPALTYLYLRNYHSDFFNVSALTKAELNVE